MAGTGKPLSYKFILFLLLVIAVGGMIFWLWKTNLETQKSKIEKVISYVKSEYEFARLSIHGISSQNASFTLTLLNIDGVPVAKKDYNINGSDIFIESKVVVIKTMEQERAFVFPSRIYSDVIPPQNGYDILPLYVNNNNPKNYTSVNLDLDIASIVKNIYIFAFSGNENPADLEKNSIKVVLNMDAVLHRSSAHGFHAGGEYRCIVHPGGGLELLEVQ